MLVLPYRSATQSGVAQIALHFEKPALVTRVGGLPEIIEHGETGYIADPDPENIAFMINQYFNNPYKDKMLEEIKKKKEEFSWKHFVKRLTEFSGEI
jgi:glycosyltransferase involved in cell wall biosynthesis